MNFKQIPLQCQVAYAWLWNTTITREESHRQIDEMYEAGIRAMYVLAEPENFRPTLRRTFLSPDYLSDEYLDLLFDAYEYARSKGMYTWLYNEGGFPSGMASGQIRAAHPELAIAGISSDPVTLPAGTPYKTSEGHFAGYIENDRIAEGTVFDEDKQIREYCFTSIDDDRCINRADIAQRETTDLFIQLTHERLKARFGERVGKEITLMFDDEAHMGSWTAGLEKEFLKEYGYDMCDYIPHIFRRDKVEFKTERERRVYGDYRMLCGKLMRENYFRPMREWLNARGMLSTGHLGGEDMIGYFNGNLMATLREYDVPGVDAIWSQITYPKDETCTPESFEFYPRVASSAARQQGHDLCVSESFCVYGSYLTPEEMRFGINFQAVRGISMFNFMVISYERKTAIPHQYRPNFIPENPGADCLGQINDYTARISHLLQSGKSVVKTALYYPQRSIFAYGATGARSSASFECLGRMLERAGVSFDIIDEDLLKNATVKDGVLCCEKVCYENVFVPEGSMELPHVTALLEKTRAAIVPDLVRRYGSTLSRHVTYEDGEGYLIFNQSGETVEELLEIESELCPYLVDLATGELFAPAYTRRDGKVSLALTLGRGEAAMIYLTKERDDVAPVAQYEPCASLARWRSFVSREYLLDAENGMRNIYHADGPDAGGLGEWPVEFSGEVTYKTTLPAEAADAHLLDLGKVRHYAKVYLNGKKIAEATMPPYRVPLHGAKEGDELCIVVANTPANVIGRSDYFEHQDIADVGPYHANMKPRELAAPAGAFLGPVRLLKKIN